MADEEPLVPDIDVTRPTIARVYDFWLGGKNNYAVDRETGGRMTELNPALPELIRHNREFICAAAARAAATGISQFLDLGSGLPTQPAVHEAARKVNPNARVCYVDNDPMAVIHATAMLTGDGLAVVEADLGDPEAVLAHPDVRAVLDFAQPVGIILGSVLHFMPAEVAAELCARYMSRAVPGSWLIVSTGHYEDRELEARVQEAGTYTRFWSHDAAAMATWLAGLETVSPGICEANRWIAATGGVPAWPTYTLVAAAVKTA